MSNGLIDNGGYVFWDEEDSPLSAYKDCKIVFDGIIDDDTFQEADMGLVLYHAKEIMLALKSAAQSAQQEIIRCKDCKKHNISVGYKEDCCPLYEYRGMSYGHEHDYQFCSFAERRTDGSD